MKTHDEYTMLRGDRPTATVKPYEYPETQELVQLVDDAAHLLTLKGEAALNEFRIPGSRWQKGETYIFVLDPNGKMLVHPDPELEGKNQLGLKDINGKPIIRGLLDAATALPDKPEGWYHYQWPVPGGLLPRWKSSYVRLVKVASGKTYIVGSGMYNDRMEKAFVVDAVMQAVGALEKNGKAAFQLFHDPTGPFIAKDAYIFVADMDGVELVNPAFPNIEGRKLLDLSDTNGKFLYQEMIRLVKTQDSGWIDYMWPKPGESVSTRKSAFVKGVVLGNQKVLVGCGVYLADAPMVLKPQTKMTASELRTFVHQAAALLETQGEMAYAEFRNKGSRWFRDDVYLFVFTMDGTRAFHAAEPESEGRNDGDLKDIVGRPIVKMILDTGSTSFGEGWVHYMYPQPNGIFPAWKSSYVKRVTFPSGKEYIVGCGIYNMQMDKAFIEDLVHHAAALVADRGQEAFVKLRDKTGPFYFMDTYVFVLSPEGIELVNPGLPGLEGKNIIDLKDLKGKPVIREEIEAAMTEGSTWLDCNWYLPGSNATAQKQAFVRKVQHNNETYIIGSGFYGGEGPEGTVKVNSVQKIAWQALKAEKLNDKVSRQTIFGEKGTLTRFVIKRNASVARHYHISEEYMVVLSGAVKFIFDDREVALRSGEVVVIPPNVPHALVALEDTEFVDFFAPAREDWLRGEDQYLRK